MRIRKNESLPIDFSQIIPDPQYIKQKLKHKSTYLYIFSPKYFMIKYIKCFLILEWPTKELLLSHKAQFQVYTICVNDKKDHYARSDCRC